MLNQQPTVAGPQASACRPYQGPTIVAPSPSALTLVTPLQDTEHLAMLYDWRYIQYVVGVVTNDTEKMAAMARAEVRANCRRTLA